MARHVKMRDILQSTKLTRDEDASDFAKGELLLLQQAVKLGHLPLAPVVPVPLKGEFISRMTGHSGRRTFCTKLCEAGTSIHIVAALDGHRHIATTAVDLTADPNIMRNAVALAQ